MSQPVGTEVAGGVRGSGRCLGSPPWAHSGQRPHEAARGAVSSLGTGQPGRVSSELRLTSVYIPSLPGPQSGQPGIPDPPPSTSHLSWEKTQSRELLNSSLPRLAALPPLSKRPARLGRVTVGVGRTGAQGLRGTHCSLQPASLGFQDNLREGRGGTGPCPGL